MNYYQPILADTSYHIMSRAIGNEKLFLTSENYMFFLRRFNSYISPIADLYAFNLLPNHFHAIIEVKSSEDLLPLYKAVKKSHTLHEMWQPDFVMQQFSNLFNSYAKSFNLRNKRKGSLFMEMCRVPIRKDSQFSATVFYVHKNAVHHGYCKTIQDWPWSSYNEILSASPTNLKRKEMIEWFGGEAEFIKFHSQEIYLKNSIALE